LVFRGVREAATGTLEEPCGQFTVIGCDWGKIHDFSVFTVLASRPPRLVDFDRMREIDYQLQVQRLASLCEKWRPSKVVVELNSVGEPLAEILERLGLPIERFTTTASSKRELIEGLALAVERQAISFPNVSTLVAELESFECKRSPSGSFTYSAPSGVHDDFVMSLALAWHGGLPQRRTYYEKHLLIEPGDVQVGPW